MVSCKFSLKPIQRLEFCTFAFENQLEGQKIALEDDFPGAFPLVSGHEISAGERYGACPSEELRSTLQGSRALGTGEAEVPQASWSQSEWRPR